MSEIKLGKLINPNSNHERDAIHIAVCPVVAAEDMNPGEHIGFFEPGNTELVRVVPNPIGIVDPFLAGRVLARQRFFMLLYPQTITGLRHVWTHPAFAFTTDEKIAVARKWIEDLAADIKTSYERLMEAAEQFATDERCTYDNSERFKDVSNERWEEFWTHYAIVTGKTVRDFLPYDFIPFACSC